VPLATSKLSGVDALYAVVQMPGGIPVACVAIDGAKNAALLAAAIISLKDAKVRAAYKQYRKKLSEGSK
jgi:5-(carboxyamino)imidazole ribonucleotide mutase